MQNSIRRSVALNWASLGLRIGVSFLLLPFIVGYLGDAGYGEYLLVVAVFGYAEILDFGLKATALRYVALFSARGELGRLNRILGLVLQYYGLIAVLVVGFGVVAALTSHPWLVPKGADQDFPRLLFLFSLASATMFFSYAWQSVLEARSRFDAVNGILIGAFLCRAAFIVVALSRGHGVEVIILGDALQHALCFIGYRLAARHHFPEFQPTYGQMEREDLRLVTGYSSWVVLNSFSAQLRHRAPNLLLGWTVNTAAVAVFGVAARIQSYVFQLSTASNSPIRSRLSQLDGERDREGLATLLFAGSRLLSYQGLVSALVFCLFAPDFMAQWLGEDFRQSGAIVQLLLLGLAAEITQLVPLSALYATGRHQVVSLLNFLEACLIVGVGWWLIQRLGTIGAAWGVALPIFLVKLVVQPGISARLLGYGYFAWAREALARPALAAALATPLAWWISGLPRLPGLVGILAAMALAGLPYLASGWWLALRPEERGSAARLARRLLPG